MFGLLNVLSSKWLSFNSTKDSRQSLFEQKKTLLSSKLCSGYLAKYNKDTPLLNEVSLNLNGVIKKKQYCDKLISFKQFLSKELYFFSIQKIHPTHSFLTSLFEFDLLKQSLQASIFNTDKRLFLLAELQLLKLKNTNEETSLYSESPSFKKQVRFSPRVQFKEILPRTVCFNKFKKPNNIAYMEFVEELLVDIEICRKKSGRRHLHCLSRSIVAVIDLLDFKQHELMLCNQMKRLLNKAIEELQTPGIFMTQKIQDQSKILYELIYKVLSSNKASSDKFIAELEFQLQQLYSKFSCYYEFGDEGFEIALKDTYELFESYTQNIKAFINPIKCITEKEFNKKCRVLEDYYAQLGCIKDDFSQPDVLQGLDRTLDSIHTFICAFEHVFKK